METINQENEITSKLLLEINYKNKTLINKLRISEDKKQINDQFIEHYNTLRSNFENKYNTKESLIQLNKTYNKELDTIKNNYNSKYKELQDILSKLEFDKNRKLDVNSIYNESKVTIDIKNDTIFRKNNYKLILNTRINQLELTLIDLEIECNKKLNDIYINYDEILLEYPGEQTPCKMEGGGGNSNITDVKIQNKINTLKKFNSDFEKSKDKYITDEETFRNNHVKLINEEKIIIQTNLTNSQNYYNLELTSMNTLIDYYNKLNTLDNYENINTIITKMDNEITQLDIDIEKQEEKFIKLNNSVKSYSTLCQQKINKLNCYKNNNKIINNNIE